MKLFYKLLFVVVTLLNAYISVAQDQQFTQFYASPLYLNPAFAGSSIQSRVALNYRNQWPGISGKFISYNASYDQYFSRINSGFGLMFSNDKSGTGILQNTNLGVQYAYELHINREFSIRPAINFSFGMNSIDIDKLTFGDQLRNKDNTVSSDPDRGAFSQSGNIYADFGAGGLLFSENLWLGISTMHINEPNQSLLQKETKLPVKLSVHGGGRINISKFKDDLRKQHILPCFNYRAQGKYDQLDLGFYYEYDPVTFGLWYRGLPGIKKNNYGYLNHDDVALLVGYQINQLKMGYSYDITISRLAANTVGSHEISVMIEWASIKSKKKTKRRVIPCAKF